MMERIWKSKPNKILTVKLKEGKEIQISKKEMDKWGNNIVEANSIEINLNFLDIKEFQYLRNIWDNKGKKKMISLVDLSTIEQLILNLRASILLVLEYNYILEELLKREKAGIVLKILRELNLHNVDLFKKVHLMITERLRKGERGETVVQWLEFWPMSRREMFAPILKEDLYLGLVPGIYIYIYIYIIILRGREI